MRRMLLVCAVRTVSLASRRPIHAGVPSVQYSSKEPMANTSILGWVRCLQQRHRRAGRVSVRESRQTSEPHAQRWKLPSGQCRSEAA